MKIIDIRVSNLDTHESIDVQMRHTGKLTTSELTKIFDKFISTYNNQFSEGER